MPFFYQQRGVERNRGFIALISSIVISAIMMALAATLSGSTLYARFDALNSEYKRISLGLGESCVNIALLKTAQDYNYTPSVGGDVIQIGVDAQGQPQTCTIKSVLYSPEVNGKKTAVITTVGAYRGVFTNNSVSVEVQNPKVQLISLPPACNLIASPTVVPSGRQTTLLWSTSANAISFSIDHGVGNVTPVASGQTSPITMSGSGDVIFKGTATNNSGGQGTCTAIVTVAPPPPSPACADSVMVLDRTGSMSSSDLSNEKNAASALVDLYAGVSSPFPQVGAGSFGAYPNQSLPGGAASIPTNGVLSTSYSVLKTLISQMTGSNSSVGSDLSAAINVGAAELNSNRHINNKQKVLILVSDGVPNEPSAGPAISTSFKSPSSETQNASGDFWSSPGSAFADGGGDASALVSGGKRHRFYNFNFPTVPGNAVIKGIEASFDAWATAIPIPSSKSLNLSSQGTFDQWSANTGSDVSAVGNNNGDTSYISTSNGIDTFNVSNAAIPAGSTINSVTLTALARGTASGATLVLVTDKGSMATLTQGPTQTLTTSYAPYSRVMTTDPSTGNPWTPAEVNSWNTKFGVRAVNNGGVNTRVTQFTVTIDYNAPAPTSCELRADLSWNGGGNWTSEKNQTLSNSEATYTLGSPSDDWSNTHTWQPSDFTNANFRARVHAVDPGSACDSSAVEHLDWLRVGVSYTIPSDPFGAATAAAVAAKSPGGADSLPVNIFTIHFGDTSGRAFLGSLASPTDTTKIPVSTIIPNGAVRTSNKVTITTSALHKLTKGETIQIAGVADASFNGTFYITAVPSPTTFQYDQTGTNKTSSGGSVTPTNLFIAPLSSDMQGIFNSIGTQICPAAAALCANSVDDDGDGLIDESDPGCHSDGNAADPNTYDSSDNDEWQTVPTPLPPKTPLLPNITVGSWVEVQ